MDKVLETIDRCRGPVSLIPLVSDSSRSWEEPGKEKADVGRKKGQEMSAEEFLLQEWSLMFSIACPISSSRRSHILITEALPLSRVQAIQTNQYITTMVLDSLSSPHRRSQNTFFVSSAKKPQSSRDDSWSALVERHRFLLTTLLVLAFLCTIYLYFAVTLGASDACTGLAGAERIECQARSVLQHGKLKFR
ncbi:unnamed protein product [Miscanthus lutarioriparius]|uniref:Uncharacterized protein n=2 Tax=Miscanthus TaxID=62336 RepID=A0A811R6L7_9POAL|nr:unnamed protein product [Miscanthus lutarioriparius]